MMNKVIFNKKRTALAVTAALLILALCAGILYVGDYYRADTAAFAAFPAADTVEKLVIDNRTTAYIPQDPVAGLIFYPGGKVEALAYEPLMTACASRGILCLLVRMPCNLAVLDVHAAEGLPEQFPQISDWYIGGHSLGGSMAASCLAKHTDTYRGLVLLGAYSTADLSGSSMKVLSVYGNEDRIMNREKYETYRANLPEDFTELLLEGRCHAYFGVYGPQDGDGSPTITNETQISLTAEAIRDLVQ